MTTKPETCPDCNQPIGLDHTYLCPHTADPLPDLVWIALHPHLTPDHLGYIPSFLSVHDPRPAAEQIASNYVAGWNPFSGFTVNPKTKVLSYPGDPPFGPVARTRLRDEELYFYPHSWFMVLQKDGSHEIARLD